MPEITRIESKARLRHRELNAALLIAGLPLLLSLGCSSSASRKAEPASTDAAASSPQVATPAQIRTLKLREEGKAVTVDLTADRALVWTTYRDGDGNLVVELPNSVPAATVEKLAPARGLVAAVDVELLDDAERPLTRLVVRTREESEHSLAADGSTLHLQLLPVGYEAPVALAYEPLPDARSAGAGTAAAGERPAAPRPATSQATASGGSYGTPEEPYVAPSPTGVAATRLTGVEVLESAGTTVVLVRGDGEFAFTTFRLENPERFIVDLSGVVNTSQRSTVSVGSSFVEQVRIGQFKPRPDPVSRVVFDLSRFEPPAIERSADGLKITFGAGARTAGGATPTLAETTMASTTPASSAPPPATEPADAPVADEEVAAAPAPPPEEPATTGARVGELAEVSEPVPAYVPPAAAPVYEPPPAPPVMASGEGVAIARPAEKTDVAQFEAQQVQVQQPAGTEERRIPSFGAVEVHRANRQYVGEPVSFTLNNADLVETLRTFSRLSDLNFVIQPGVRGSVTVELNSVPWDQALEQILRINNLGTEIDGTIVRIAPLTQLRAEAEERRQLEAARAQAIPLTTIMRPLSYASAGDISTLLRNRQGAILSSRGTVQVDRRTNTLIIRELPGYIDTVLAVIENLDTPEPQVSIEARIVEASKQFTRTLGIQWGFDQIANAANGNTTGLEFPNNIASDGGVSLLTGGANGFLNLSMGNILNTFTLDAALVAAESEGLVNVVSAPRVTTLNNERATIQSGTQIPIQTISNQTVTVQFVNATLQLSVTPHVTAEGTIQLDIDVSKKEPVPAFALAGATNSPISTKEAQTKVIVRDGGTAVIGGIYEVSNNQNQDRVPGLANIPVLGHLFKNRSTRDQNEELMIFITPRIIQM